MTELTVRRSLLVDLQTDIPRRWAGGDAFRSALFNALSMSFPSGEVTGLHRFFHRKDAKKTAKDAKD